MADENVSPPSPHGIGAQLKAIKPWQWAIAGGIVIAAVGYIVKHRSSNTGSAVTLTPNQAQNPNPIVIGPGDGGSGSGSTVLPPYTPPQATPVTSPVSAPVQPPVQTFETNPTIADGNNPYSSSLDQTTGWETVHGPGGSPWGTTYTIPPGETLLGIGNGPITNNGNGQIFLPDGSPFPFAPGYGPAINHSGQSTNLTQPYNIFDGNQNLDMLTLDGFTPSNGSNGASPVGPYVNQNRGGIYAS